MQGVTGGQQDLAPHHVDAGNHLGDRMLDLNSRIDLDEEKLAGIDVDQKLYRAGRSILHRAAQTDGRLADALPELLRQVRARRNFDNLLMTTLYRAVAFPEMDELAVRVTENLHFDVLRPRDVALEKDLGLAEGSRGLSHRLRNLLGQFAGGCDDPDAATAAAKAGLDDERKSDTLSDGRDVVALFEGGLGARNRWHTHRVRKLPRGDLVAERLEMT